MGRGASRDPGSSKSLQTETESKDRAARERRHGQVTKLRYRPRRLHKPSRKLSPRLRNAEGRTERSQVRTVASEECTGRPREGRMSPPFPRTFTATRTVPCGPGQADAERTCPALQTRAVTSDRDDSGANKQKPETSFGAPQARVTAPRRRADACTWQNLHVTWASARGRCWGRRAC